MTVIAAVADVLHHATRVNGNALTASATSTADCVDPSNDKARSITFAVLDEDAVDDEQELDDCVDEEHELDDCVDDELLLDDDCVDDDAVLQLAVDTDDDDCSVTFVHALIAYFSSQCEPTSLIWSAVIRPS